MPIGYRVANIPAAGIYVYRACFAYILTSVRRFFYYILFCFVCGFWILNDQDLCIWKVFQNWLLMRIRINMHLFGRILSLTLRVDICRICILAKSLTHKKPLFWAFWSFWACAVGVFFFLWFQMLMINEQISNKNQIGICCV